MTKKIRWWQPFWGLTFSLLALVILLTAFAVGVILLIQGSNTLTIVVVLALGPLVTVIDAATTPCRVKAVEKFWNERESGNKPAPERVIHLPEEKD